MTSSQSKHSLCGFWANFHLLWDQRISWWLGPVPWGLFPGPLRAAQQGSGMWGSSATLDLASRFSPTSWTLASPVICQCDWPTHGVTRGGTHYKWHSSLQGLWNQRAGAAGNTSWPKKVHGKKPETNWRWGHCLKSVSLASLIWVIETSDITTSWEKAFLVDS